MPRTRPERTNPLPSIAEPVIDRYRRWTPVWYRWIEPLLQQTRETADRVEAVDDNASALIAAEAVVRASEDDALAQQITTLSATVVTNESEANALITAEQVARAAADSALASDITTLETTVGSNTASITTLSASINGVEAQWGISVNVNNRITGAIRLDADLTTSTFAVLANRFEVVHPTNNGLTQTVFVTGNVNGVPTVGINGNVVVDGTILARHIAADSITAAQIQANAITTSELNAGAVTADKIQANAVTADKIVANSITSAKIATDAVTADKINVTSLEAVSGTMGSLTTGRIQSPDGRLDINALSNTPYIRLTT